MGIDGKFDAEADQVSGKLKETAGQLTDNERLENEGKAESAKGGLKDAVEDVKDAAHKAADTIKDALK